MFKGYFKADEEALAWGLFGGLIGLGVGEVVSKKGGRKIKPVISGGLGVVAGELARAVADPDLVAERRG